MTDLRDHPYITTFSGARFRYDVPGPFLLEDVAHSLSMTVRFRGHTLYPYTVAQHSVHVAKEMLKDGHSDEWALAGLLHDAHEAYVGDLPSPLKWACPEFKVIEDRVQNALRLAMTPDVPAAVYDDLVKRYDLLALHREAKYLFLSPPEWARPEPHELEIVVWTMRTARHEFLRLARRLHLK